jgi:hypothetical protein
MQSSIEAALVSEARAADELVHAQRRLLATTRPLAVLEAIEAIDGRWRKEAARLVIANQRCGAATVIQSHARKVRPSGRLSSQCQLRKSLRTVDAMRRPLAEEACAVLNSHVSSLIARACALRRRTLAAPRRDSGGRPSWNLLKAQSELLAVERSLRSLGTLEATLGRSLSTPTAKATERGTAKDRSVRMRARENGDFEDAGSEDALALNEAVVRIRRLIELAGLAADGQKVDLIAATSSSERTPSPNQHLVRAGAEAGGWTTPLPPSRSEARWTDTAASTPAITPLRELSNSQVFRNSTAHDRGAPAAAAPAAAAPAAAPASASSVRKVAVVDTEEAKVTLAAREAHLCAREELLRAQALLRRMAHVAGGGGPGGGPGATEPRREEMKRQQQLGEQMPAAAAKPEDIAEAAIENARRVLHGKESGPPSVVPATPVTEESVGATRRRRPRFEKSDIMPPITPVGRGRASQANIATADPLVSTPSPLSSLPSFSSALVTPPVRSTAAATAAAAAAPEDISDDACPDSAINSAMRPLLKELQTSLAQLLTPAQLAVGGVPWGGSTASAVATTASESAVKHHRRRPASANRSCPERVAALAQPRPQSTPALGQAHSRGRQQQAQSAEPAASTGSRDGRERRPVLGTAATASVRLSSWVPLPLT